MNKAIISGRLTRDVSLKTSEVSVARFTVAVDRPRTKDGKEGADFISCVAFGKQAEFVGKYFGKGKPIILEGHIQTGSYEDREGHKVYTTDVITERVEFMLQDKTSAAEEGFKEIDTDDVPF